MVGEITGMVGEITGMVGEITDMVGESLRQKMKSQAWWVSPRAPASLACPRPRTCAAPEDEITGMVGEITGMVGEITGMVGESLRLMMKSQAWWVSLCV
jgi:phage-related protein